MAIEGFPYHWPNNAPTVTIKQADVTCLDPNGYVSYNLKPEVESSCFYMTFFIYYF